MGKVLDFFNGIISHIGEGTIVPQTLALEQNYPNPFNPLTQINFSLPVNGKTELTVYNILGQKVKTLVNKVMPAGIYHVQFNAESLATGTYVYELRAGNKVIRKRMILLK